MRMHTQQFASIPAGMWSSPGMRGYDMGHLGAVSDQILQAGIGTGTAVGGALAASAIGTATVGAAAVGALATAGIAVAGMAIVAWVSFMKRNGMNKENATAVANKAEQLLKDNLDEWNASHKTVEDREVALNNAQLVMSYMTGPQGCGNPQLADPGKRCINERLVEGAKYPWLDWYVNPIKDYVPTVSNAQLIADETRNTGQQPVTTRTAVVDPVSGQTTYVDTIAAPSLAAAASSKNLLFFGAVGAILLVVMMGDK